jgi:outer membrane protein assembly factor BamB
MKRLLLVFFTIAVTSCSFDKKTGIWNDASDIAVDNQSPKIINSNSSTQYENVFTKNSPFNEEKENLNFSNIKIDPPIKLINWPEQYAIPTNNISNFSYFGNKILQSRSSKLSKFSTKKNYSNRSIVFHKNNLISYDQKGTIFIYSLSLKKKIFEYNFYKRNFKNYNKKIYLIVNENVLYAADNLGYLYALNLNSNSIIWAKNYGIPFRSNLKFANNAIFLASQDNVIYSIKPDTGDKSWQFATTTTFLKADFENNIAVDQINNNLFFLNTSGELYSINYENQKLNWVLNFKNSSLVGDTDLFLSQPIVIKNNNLIVSTEKAILSYDTLTGRKNWNLFVETIVKPIVTTRYSYIISSNNLLICVDNNNGEVVWSKNFFRNIKKKIELKFGSIIDFKIVNNEINIYSKNGYLLSYNPNNGKLISLSRINKNGIHSKIFFLNENMFFVDNDNKLLKFN